MNRHSADILIVGGGAAGMSAALAASENDDLAIAIVDDNTKLGGQIWRAEPDRAKSPRAARLIDAVKHGRINVINSAQVFAADKRTLAAETLDGRIDISYKKLVIATGARERLLPFPGWTLPNVFGAGGLQALVKGGLRIGGKRIAVAGTGPLLLAVADYLRTEGGIIVAIGEQTPAAKLRKLAVELRRNPSKLVQAAAVRAKLFAVPYLTDCFVTSVAAGRELPFPPRAASTLTVSLMQRHKTWSIDCDYLACGFHLVPNVELASLVGCRIDNGFVAVDEFQLTSCENVYCAGEPTGIGGLEASLVEGRIAGYAAADKRDQARKFFRERDRARCFGQMLDTTFELRNELKHLADDRTIVCRCEDVEYGRVRQFASGREAKLQTRCGMGACQGRVCGAATEFLFGWERDRVRPPIFPVRMENL